MEIEAKYITADPEPIHRLLETDTLGAYTLQPEETLRIEDRYLDTSDRRLLRAGYACRTRRQNDLDLVTIKGLGKAEGAVHRREEIEFECPPGTPPHEWPDDRAWELVLPIIAGEPLSELFAIRQNRQQRLVKRGPRRVAMLSADEVEMGMGKSLTQSYVVEAELEETGTEEDLQALEAALMEYGLRPEPRSKFEIALDLLDHPPAPPYTTPPPPKKDVPPSAEEAVDIPIPPAADRPTSPVSLQQLCARFHVDMDHARQVAAMSLALFDNMPEVHGLPESRRRLLEAAALLHNLGMSINAEKHHTVGRDLILFETLEGFSLHERDMLACTTRFHRKRVRPEEEPVFLALPETLQKETLALAALLRVGDALDYSGSQTCRILSAGLGSDAAYLILGGPHADAETDRALKKADLWNEVFAYPLRVRSAGYTEHLTETASDDASEATEVQALNEERSLSELESAELEPELVEALGAEIEDNSPHLDEVLASDGEAIGLLEPYDGRPEDSPEEADEERFEGEIGEEVLTVPNAGEESAKNAPGTLIRAASEESKVATARGRKTTGEPGEASPPEELDTKALKAEEAAVVTQTEPPATPPPAEVAPPKDVSESSEPPKPEKTSSGKKGPGITGDDPIAEAGRKTLRFHFERVLANEAGTLEGEDIEALHDMRVATRRLRAAARLFAPYLPEKEVKRLNSGLRRTGRILGPVRDLDVMLDKIRKDAEAHEALSLEGLEPLVKAWEKQRRASRKEMLSYLHGSEYEEFKEDFERFLGLSNLSSGRKGDTAPVGSVRVRYVAPGILWEHYGQVRAYEPLLAGAPVETLHALRIDGKRFRYAMEFLREPLGKPVDKLISELTKVQDHLGELHDADVAAHLLRQFLEGWWRRAAKDGSSSSDAKGVTDYLFIREQELKEKIETFPELWENLTGESFRTRLAELTAAL